MKKQSKRNFILAAVLMGLFVLLTVSLSYVDVRPIGPQGSSVGYAGINGFVHDALGVHMGLYTVTDWLGIVPVAVGLGFAVFGLVQLIKRKHFLGVDASILLLGAFYLVVLAAYIFFEYRVVNRRPVLIDGYLEASYPSSTTMLTVCVMVTAMMQFRRRIERAGFRRAVMILCGLFTAFMVLGRLVSGVHWLTDILGGVLLSASLIHLYAAVCCRFPDGSGERKA